MRALALVVTVAAACGRRDATPSVVVPEAPPLTTAAPKPAPEPPAEAEPPPPRPATTPASPFAGSVDLPPAATMLLAFDTRSMRDHSLAKMGPILAAIPQWRWLFRGHDPVRDYDWLVVVGPSLVHTDRTLLAARYAFDDAAMDLLLEAESKRYDKGRAFDVGVPGTKAWLAYEDMAERVLARGKKIVTVAPTALAAVTAQRPPAKATAADAIRIVVKRPGKHVSIPRVRFGDAVDELRVAVIATDAGAHLFFEADAADEPAARALADDLDRAVKDTNASAFVHAATHGVLDRVRFATSGTRTTTDFAISREQLDAILGLMAAAVGATP